VKENDVGKTLDAGADVVIVMLGMNDVLAPSLKNNPADFDAWALHYGELIRRTRWHSCNGAGTCSCSEAASSSGSGSFPST